MTIRRKVISLQDALSPVMTMMAVRPTAMTPARPSQMTAAIMMLPPVVMSVVFPALLCFGGAAGHGDGCSDRKNGSESDEQFSHFIPPGRGSLGS